MDRFRRVAVRRTRLGRGAPRNTRVLAVRRNAPITRAGALRRFLTNYRGIIPRETVRQAAARNTLRRFVTQRSRTGLNNYRSRAVYRRAVNYRGRY